MPPGPAPRRRSRLSAFGAPALPAILPLTGRSPLPAPRDQGANDPRVNISISDGIVEALRKRNIPVTYGVYPGEGHSFPRPGNNPHFFGRTEEFLEKYLGGRWEPWKKIDGSSAGLR